MRTIILSVWMLLLMGSLVFADTNPQNNKALKKEIQEDLLAPCCWREPISVHDSQIAEKMRHEVDQMVDDGQSKETIITMYVKQYGEKILAVPPKTGFSLVAWILPGVMVVLGLIFSGMLLLRWRQNYSQTGTFSTNVSELSSDMNDRIEKELGETV